MKKNETTAVSKKDHLYQKIARIMKLTFAFLLIACLQVSARGFSQDRITLKMNEAEIKKVLFAIEKKTNYRFLFNESAFKRKPKVTIDAVDASVTDLLDKILANTGVSYKILGSKLVVLKEGIASGEIASQDLRVSGKVTGDNGEPLVGVSVSVKGSRTGTTTDANGNFSLTVPDDAVLVFSSVGYESVEMAVAGKSTLNVSMVQSSRKIDEVVVIGYGTASKRDLTGSIVKVAGKDIADKPNTNPVSSLQARVAGLTIINNGTPGAAPDIRIRGTNSLGGNLQPLYVVDGIFNDNIDYINPSDIESIEVLKDPSSLAIFGVRGANGVIAVTTKKGKAGQTVINFNTAFGFKKLVDKIAWANASEFQTLYEEEKVNIGANSPFDYGKWTANTDWVDAVTRTGKFNTNNLSIATSTEKNRFYMGVGYTTDEGIIKHEKLKKLQLTITDELKVNKFLKLGFNINTVKQDNPYGASWVLDAARKVIPQVSAGTKTVFTKNPYGLDSNNYNLYYELPIIQNSGVINPLLILENEYNKTISQENRIVASAFAEFTLHRNLTFKSTVYADMSSVNARVYTPVYNAYDAANDVAFLYSRRSGVRESDDTYKKFQTDNILTYKGRIASDHNITGMVGFTTYDFRYAGRFGSSQQSITGNAVPDDKRFWYVTNGFEDPLSVRASSAQYQRTTASFLTRALYNYKGKYYFNASFRMDGTSVFPNNRWQPFWAVGAAWELTKEEFMQEQNVIDFLKLKASTGVLGVQNTGGYNYPAYPLLRTGSAAVFGDLVYTAAENDYLADENLKWETNKANEIGVELDAFKRRLHFEAAYYSKKTEGLLSRVNNGGLSDGLLNQGALKNSGMEFSASWTQSLNRDLSITVGGNLTTFNNKVLSLAGDGKDIFDGPSITRVGSPIGSFYGYVVEGVYQSYAEKLASPVNTEFSYGPGDLKYKDVNGDGVINTDDKTIIGNPTPDFTYGGNVSVKYKGFDLGLDFGGVYGNEIFRVWGATESPFQRVNYPKFKINRWTGEGTSNWDPILGQDHRINYENSTYSIEDGSYFRLRNVQVGYNVEPKFISKLKMKSLRLFFNMQNAKTWKNNLGYSPEFGGSATSFSVDRAGNAIPMVTTFGLNVNF
ncbi:MAG: TonB-dependent receptor [Chitinophagaceae bacterium]|nr:TonB-dependent receptor [Chitinophagaceae bacterium]